MKTFLTIFKLYVDLKWPLQTIWIKIRPHDTWSLIFDPFCFIPSISFCWKQDIEILSILKIVPEFFKGTVSGWMMKSMWIIIYEMTSAPNTAMIMLNSICTKNAFIAVNCICVYHNDMNNRFRRFARNYLKSYNSINAHSNK